MRKSLTFLVLSIVSMSTTGQIFTNYTTTNGLLSNDVRGLSIDGNGNVWFATQNGVSVYDGMNWTSHTTLTDTGLVDNSIEAIAANSNGEVWVGTNFGVSHYNGKNWKKYTTADGLDNNQILSIAMKSNGDVWFGSINGASMFNGSNWTTFGTGNGLPFGGVSSFAFATNGDVYMGTWLGGVAVYDGTNISIIKESNGLLNDQVRALTIDGQNNRWIATSDGISVFDAQDMHVSDHTRLFVLPPPDTLNPVEDVKVDKNGNIWAGIYVDYLVTEGGVSFYNGSSWTDYDMSDGLIGPAVRELAIDNSNNIWVATSTGISKISNVPSGFHPEIPPSSFTFYPNPSNGNLNLSFKTAQEFPLHIYSSEMKLLVEFSKNMLSESSNIDLNHLEQGVYFMKYGTTIKKLVLHR